MRLKLLSWVQKIIAIISPLLFCKRSSKIDLIFLCQVSKLRYSIYFLLVFILWCPSKKNQACIFQQFFAPPFIAVYYRWFSVSGLFEMRVLLVVKRLKLADPTRSALSKFFDPTRETEKTRVTRRLQILTRDWPEFFLVSLKVSYRHTCNYNCVIFLK